MSASRERKKRVEQEPVPAKKTAKKKLSEGWIFAICVALVFALIVGGIVSWRAITRNRTVLTVGGTDIPAKEFNYFYSATARNLGNYASYFGIDTAKALDEQKVSLQAVNMLPVIGFDSSYLDGKANDGTVYDVTWAQLIAFNTRQTAAQAHAIAQAAQKDGFKLDTEDYDTINTEIANLKPYAEQNGETVDELIERVFGDGCDEESYRAYMELVQIAQKYPSTLEYSDEEISTFYSENEEEYEVAAYYSYKITPNDIATEAAAAATPAEDETTAEDTTAPADDTAETPVVTDENRAEAKKAAEAMAASFDTENDKVTLNVDRNKAAVKSAISEDAANWLFDEADDKTAKLFVVSAEGAEDTYYVVKLVSKDDYASVNAMQLFVSADTDTTGTQQADKITAIDAALAEDSSDAAFRKLIAQYNESDGDGVVEGATRGGLNNTNHDLLTWAMEPRTAGDYTKVTIEATSSSNGGTMYLFYTGEGESYRHLVITNALRNKWLEDLTTATLAVCDYSESAAMGGKVDLILGSN